MTAAISLDPASKDWQPLDEPEAEDLRVVVRLGGEDREATLWLSSAYREDLSREVVREATERAEVALGVWLDAWEPWATADRPDGVAGIQVQLVLAKAQPTHRIEFREGRATSRDGAPTRVDLVRLVDEGDGLGPAYDHGEWRPREDALWELTAEGWRHDGEATPDGVPGRVDAIALPRE